ncbi:MAG: helix-turn-helix transcriptional regulator [Anaerolineae bacterium]
MAQPFTSGAPLLFFEKTYPHDALLSPVLLHLRTALENGHAHSGWIEEHMHLLMQRLLHVHHRVYQEVEALPAARPATREELYRRLQCARDYAAALFDTPVTLAQLADVACLSPNHLLRTFKQLFGQTPHQFITDKRLEEAQRLLLTTDTSITEICFAVGFESLGTFSWLFRRRFGFSPKEFRKIR